MDSGSVPQFNASGRPVPAPPCEGLEHELGWFGHAGPARFLVRICCPTCGVAGREKRLCLGRVLDGLDSGAVMFCDACDFMGTVHAFWTIDDLGDEWDDDEVALVDENRVRTTEGEERDRCETN